MAWITSLWRWVVGATCAVVGAALLIAPHHRLRLADATGRGRLDLPGFALVLAGFLLLFVETFRPGRRMTSAVHLGTALVLTCVAWVFADHHAWTGCATLGAIATLVGLAPLVWHLRRHVGSGSAPASSMRVRLPERRQPARNPAGRLTLRGSAAVPAAPVGVASPGRPGRPRSHADSSHGWLPAIRRGRRKRPGRPRSQRALPA